MLSRGLLLLGLAACGLARSVPQKIARQDPASAQDPLSIVCGDLITDVDKKASIDFAGELEKIKQRVEAGAYHNQYDFEVDVQLLTYALKDGHVSLNAGILSAFSFGSPFEITSVSIDGKQAPKIYITDDLLPEVASEPWTPSPISTINETQVDEFVKTYAALNAWGYIEPHAEWNDLISNPTLDIQGGLTTFSGAGTFYPGENLTFTFENGTSLDTIWIAIYNEPANATGPLTTDGDFYNYFVLGLLPASYEPQLSPPEDTSDSDSVQSAPGNWSEASYGAFPENPDIVQYDLGLFYSGLVTGYYYRDISTGVLSLPSFNPIPETAGNWSDAVVSFIQNASDAGVDKVVIDLQRNSGGTPLLAYTTFKLFFPDLTPFAGSRRRSFDLANVLGSATTQWWDSLNEANDAEALTKYENAANEWVTTDRLNALSGKNFSSWFEYQGPVEDKGDRFSLVERYDLANPIFDTAAFDEWIPLMYLPDKNEWPFTERTFAPDQIVLLTDGLCASACALFVEMMTQAGVKTIVAGGRPENGPMQTASGTRGARSYDTYSLDSDMSFARSIDNSVDVNVNATVPEVRDSAIYINYAAFNLRDQIRKSETTPLQFKYEAADCRIYYTVANIYNMTRLWHDVSAAAFKDSSLCVVGSTGYSQVNNTNPIVPPKPDSRPAILSLNNTAIEQVKWYDDNGDSLFAGKSSTGTRNNNPYPDCVKVTGGEGCFDPGSVCRTISVYCTRDKKRVEKRKCLPECRNQSGSSSCQGSCKIESPSGESKPVFQNAAGTQFQERLSTGYCYPTVGTKALGCSADG